MTTGVTFDEHLATIAAQARLLSADAEEAGMGAKVPSCPGWAVSDLIAHLGVVHRWATAQVQEQHADDPEDLVRAAAASIPEPADLTSWLRCGAEELVKALREAPADLKALVFLKNAPAPREFWARRQAHETTIHRADALSARLGHLPTAAQFEVSPALALDGLDELLTGFLPRSSSALRTAEPIDVTIAPSDSDRAWTLHLSAEPPVVSVGGDRHAGAVLSGTAVSLYLSLWNRGDEVSEIGHADVLGIWRDKMRIRWR